MNLIVDYGNTRVKWAVFDHTQLIKVGYGEEELLQLDKSYQFKYVYISSVLERSFDWTKNIDASVLYLDRENKLPFNVDYKTPNTLGLDRIAAVAGAQSLFPEQNCLVIDMGTCITYEIIDDAGTYFGGGISPGMQMRFKAMHTFTAKLPLIEPEENVPLVGQSTKDCMLSGVINGIVAEIHEIIRMYNYKFANLRIIVCGGDAQFFENRLKPDIFAAPELVLRGLNRILLYNV